MTDPFTQYSKKALSAAPKRLIGVTKTRAEIRAVYTAIVAEMMACQTLAALRDVQANRRLEILQIQAEMPALWFGDGYDFLGLEREIESAFEAVEAAQFFTRLRAQPAGESGRSPGHLEQKAMS